MRLFLSIPRRSRCVIAHVGVVASALLILANSASAQTDAELIGSDLDIQRIKITSLHDQTLSYFDQQRILQSKPIREFVQLRSVNGVDQIITLPYPSISLVDGQVLTGEWLGAVVDGTGLRWRHEVLGDFEVSLDEVKQIVWNNPPLQNAVSQEQGGDTITLNNGDHLTGFVTSLSKQGVELIPASSTQPVTIPYARIASLALANPDQQPQAFTYRLTLIDGTKIFGEDLNFSGDEFSWLATPPGQSPRSVQVMVEEVARIEFGASGYRLIDLTTIPMQQLKPTNVFGLDIPARVIGQTIHAHAPAKLVFDLPSGSNRLIANAQLAGHQQTDRDSEWADFHMIVLNDEIEIGRYHLNDQNPLTHINLPISGAKLVFRLESGVNGPILDRLLLRDAVILLKQTATGQ